ncbi:hypothetical protein OZ410_10400 [Robiginitalea sp. M366]|uniref:hypothetical protein n=1 Tax=Robiginitalea aestuariiviva TaxID=3036903 RepID=UPI00240E9716|nr:hypothetical protein [Robiginitalea aestuariiviva]MDG1572726.1 hypothetical protein [Robiginitalea aestuariiviva]
MPWKQLTKRENGSYFHCITPEIQQRLQQQFPVDFPEAYRMFYSGRHALKFLISHIQQQREVLTIWMPEYYCQHVNRWMQHNYPNLAYYPSHPFNPAQPITLPPGIAATDILVVNNYWGVSEMPIFEAGERPVIIEDHSHAWLSRQSLHSQADYCFVSLRKSLPIPLGGICWKPGGTLPVDPLEEDPALYAAWDLMATAMQHKTAYLTGTEQVEKSLYLGQIAEVEEALDVSHVPVRMRPGDQDYVRRWMEVDVLGIKEQHLAFLFGHLTPSRHYRIIQRQGHPSFGLMLLFEDAAAYTSFRSFLIEREIYPSNLWPDNREWQYFLNLHIDFRYGQQHLEHIAETLNTWNRNNP